MTTVSVEILSLLPQTDSVVARFFYTDLPHASTQAVVGIPVVDGTYLSGAALIEHLAAHAPTRAWFEDQEARNTALAPQMASIPADLLSVLPIKGLNIDKSTLKWYEELTVAPPALVDGFWVRQETIRDIRDNTPLAELKTKLKAQITAKRYEVETGGIELNGVQVETNRETQAILSSAWIKASSDPSITIRWKGVNDWALLNQQMILALGDAVFNHVQACFNHESHLHSAVDASESVADLNDIDLINGWPV